jgi:hypothetical protein
MSILIVTIYNVFSTDCAIEGNGRIQYGILSSFRWSKQIFLIPCTCELHNFLNKKVDNFLSPTLEFFNLTISVPVRPYEEYVCEFFIHFEPNIG